VRTLRLPVVGPDLLTSAEERTASGARIAAVACSGKLWTWRVGNWKVGLAPLAGAMLMEFAWYVWEPCGILRGGASLFSADLETSFEARSAADGKAAQTLNTRPRAPNHKP
jgi:hypothetical protein